ncbi:MAG: MFS transporter [bacterium]
MVTVIRKPRKPAAAKVSAVTQFLFYNATFDFWAALYTSLAFLPLHALNLPGASKTSMGLAMALYAASLVAFRIPLGEFSDRLGKRRPFIIAGFLLIALGFLIVAFSPNIWVFALGRFVTGMGATTWVVITVLFSSYYESGKVPKVMGRLTSMMGISPAAVGFALAFCAYLFGGYSGQLLLYVSVALALAGSVAAIWMKEVPIAKSERFSWIALWKSILKSMADSFLLKVSVVAAVTLLVVFTVPLCFFSVYAEELGSSGPLMVFLGGAMFLSFAASSFSVSFLVAKWHARSIMLWGVSLMALGSLAIPFIKEAGFLFLPQVAIGWGWGWTFSLLMSLAIGGREKSQQARAMGVFQAVYGVGMVLGPFLAGIIADHLGLESVFYACSILCLAPFYIVLKLPQRQRR